MKRALLPLAILATVTTVAASTPARADVSLGANFGAAVVFPRRSPERVAVGWPYSTLQTLPGIRVGFTGDVGRHEVYIDSTFWAQGSPSFRSMLLLVAYQYNFDPQARNTFYFTAGGGPVWYSEPNDGSVTFMAGGGVGFRQRVSNGHGTIREELRADFIADEEHFEQKFIVGLKFGFDLWFR